MKWLGVILCWTVIVGSFTIAKTWEWYMSFQARKTTSYLQLADDASDPQVKADYLKKFLAEVEKKNLPEYAAFFFKTERLSVKQQNLVIESLIKRCEETAQLPRESFGFAQGMTQLTGQEFEHTIISIDGIYSKALCMRFGFILYYLLAIVFIISLITVPLSIVYTIHVADNY
jgi:hypothetical protein